MKLKNKNAWSLIEILIWVFILSFIIIWIWNLIWNSKIMMNDFSKKMDLEILTMNSYNIVDNLNLDNLPDVAVFYIYKNKNTKTFDVFVWEHNYEYKYINKYWEKVENIHTYNNDIYSRIFYLKRVKQEWKKKTLIKALIKRLIR